MNRLARVKHVFVEYIPDQLEPGTLYVSIPYATVVHSCFCGCGNEVVTPVSPVGWSVTFHGDSVSLDPSVGSVELPCRSHYWIKENAVEWYGQWSEARIARGRAEDSELRAKYFDRLAVSAAKEDNSLPTPLKEDGAPSVLMRLRRYFSREQ